MLYSSLQTSRTTTTVTTTYATPPQAGVYPAPGTYPVAQTAIVAPQGTAMYPQTPPAYTPQYPAPVHGQGNPSDNQAFDYMSVPPPAYAPK